MDDWSPWYDMADKHPHLGMYVQLEIGCMACGETCGRFECIWGLNDSERNAHIEKMPCVEDIVRWRYRKPDIKEEKRERQTLSA